MKMKMYKRIWPGQSECWSVSIRMSKKVSSLETERSKFNSYPGFAYSMAGFAFQGFGCSSSTSLTMIRSVFVL